jgi:hypothetical protein
MTECCSAIGGVFTTAYIGAVHVAKAVKKAATNWDVVVDLCSLMQRVSEIAAVPLPQGASRTFDGFGAISSAKNIFKRVPEVLTGDAAYDLDEKGVRISTFSPCRCISKASQIVSNCFSVAKFLQACEVIDNKFFEIMGKVRVFGQSIQTSRIVQDIAGIGSAVFMVPVNINALIKNCQREHGLHGLLKGVYLFDLAQDCTKIVAISLLALAIFATVPPVIAACFFAAGSCISLARYIKKEKFPDSDAQTPPPPPAPQPANTLPPVVVSQ